MSYESGALSFKCLLQMFNGKLQNIRYNKRGMDFNLSGLFLFSVPQDKNPAKAHSNVLSGGTPSTSLWHPG